MRPKVKLIAALLWIVFGVAAIDADLARIAAAHAAGHAVNKSQYLAMVLWCGVVAVWVFLGVQGLKQLKRERKVS